MNLSEHTSAGREANAAGQAPRSGCKRPLRRSQPHPATARVSIASPSRPRNWLRKWCSIPAIPFGAPLVERAGDPANVFLTGATGFFSARFWSPSCSSRDAVRPSTAWFAVRTPSRAASESTRCWKSSSPASSGLDRIVPVPGDLSKPLFGLSTSAFDRLASAIDAVYHNGAMVHGLYTYPQLKPTNVLGTQESIRLAAQHRPKALHYVSTVAACPFEDTFEVKVVREEPLGTDGLLYGGYSQSKWVAEQMVLAARERGLPVCAHRRALSPGTAKPARGAPATRTCRVIKVTVDSGIVPDVEGAADMTPVDYVSKALVHLSMSGRALGQIHHLANPKPADGKDLTNWVRTSGYPLRQVPGPGVAFRDGDARQSERQESVGRLRAALLNRRQRQDSRLDGEHDDDDL